MCQPMVEKMTPASEEFFINPTPGGSYCNILGELHNHQGPIEKLVVMAGCNDLNFGCERASTSDKELLSALRAKYPTAQV